MKWNETITAMFFNIQDFFLMYFLVCKFKVSKLFIAIVSTTPHASGKNNNKVTSCSCIVRLIDLSLVTDLVGEMINHSRINQT